MHSLRGHPVETSSIERQRFRLLLVRAGGHGSKEDGVIASGVNGLFPKESVGWVSASLLG